jgi:hypothetical protein
MTSHLLALDQGTSSSRSIVFNARGQVVAMAQREFRQIYPQPGWVEHDPLELWETQLATAREVLAKAGLAAADIASIGITNQRETTVVWNRRTGQPVHNAIVWQDRRAEPTCADLRTRGLAGTFQRKTGLVLDAYFSGTKLKWILDHVDGARDAAGRGELAFGTVDSWLLWQLTRGEVHATDVSNASRTLLLDVHTNRWDEELLGLLDIPHGLLPAVHPSSHVFGQAHPDWLGAALPVGGIAGDQQSALFGQACFTPARSSRPAATASSPPAPRSRARRRSLRSRAASSSAARSCSGCATGCAPSRAAARCRRSRKASPTRAVSCSCRRSPAWAPPTGTPRRAAPSSASPAAARSRTSPVPRSRASPSRARPCCRRWPAMPRPAAGRASPNFASTVAPASTTC